MTRNELENLCEKLRTGVTYESLNTNEKWAIHSLQQEDHLYHTHWITTFKRDVDGALVFNNDANGNLIYRTPNADALKRRLIKTDNVQKSIATSENILSYLESDKP